MTTIAELLSTSPELAGLTSEQIEAVAECGTKLGVETGEYLFREGEPADSFFIIERGSVALELHAPTRGHLVIETLERNEIVGWSWLFAPYRWQFDGRAAEPTDLASFDGARVRALCEGDHELGYQLMSRFTAVVLGRLQATRVQLLDVYGRADIA
ncbi:MAG: cyclic nucleotide-binding domain-containing protein [Solirubrobacteraceae bacterium]|jgi:CRP-like cAMP-binding protein